MAQQPVQSILPRFSALFFLCKLLGIYPYNMKIYQRYNDLKKSNMGSLVVIAVMILIIAVYNMLIVSFAEEDSSLKQTQSTLTFVIGIFLTYIGLVMMATDQLSAIRNQKNLGEIYERIRKVDDRLCKEGCSIDNRSLEIRIRISVLLVFACELIIMISTYVLLLDHSKWSSLLWPISCLPTLYNSLDKIWFATTLFALQQRFAAINKALSEMVEEHDRYKDLGNKSGKSDKSVISRRNIVNGLISDVGTDDNLNLKYLYTELNAFADNRGVMKITKNRIKPVMVVAHSMNNFNNFSAKKPSTKNMSDVTYDSELSNIGRVEEKLNAFCQLHDEICEIGKTLNELWSYSILVLMAYGFLIFTAQLYFLYCATQDQAIPSLFRSAKSAIITAVFLFYTAGKCIYLIFLSWRTSLESKRTGICLHKCGVVADDNNLYEIINHLSLKLLNHSVDFTACGFFSLDMETLYGVAGGITSYLIILIQFNLAAQQAKDAVSSYITSEPTNSATENSSEPQYDYSTSLTTFITSTVTTPATSTIG